MSDRKQRFVYVLVDPRYHEIRYVGVTTDVAVRVFAPYRKDFSYQSHVTQALTTEVPSHKDYWIRGIYENGLELVVDVVDSGVWTIVEQAEREIWWIAYFISVGCDLTNKSGGGESTHLWVQSDETKKLISQRTKLAMQRPEVQAKLGNRAGSVAWNRGRYTATSLKALRRQSTQERKRQGLPPLPRTNARGDAATTRSRVEGDHGGWNQLDEDMRERRCWNMKLGRRRATAKRNGWLFTLAPVCRTCGEGAKTNA